MGLSVAGLSVLLKYWVLGFKDAKDVYESINGKTFPYTNQEIE
jgi:hypothetical protein